MARRSRVSRRAPLKPRAVFLDGGGTIVLPHRDLVVAALGRAGVEIDPARVPSAHYAAVRVLDRERTEGAPGSYAEAFCAVLGTRGRKAVGALTDLAERSWSGYVLWSEPTPGAIKAIVALRLAGLAVLIVTNSDGHAAENLRDSGILAATGLTKSDVVDSVLVGSAKPDKGIFAAALRRAGVNAADAVHVGDMVSTDVVGARRAGIAPIHFDPYRRCRSGEHRHVRSLTGIWAHLGSAVRISAVIGHPAPASISSGAGAGLGAAVP
jgi:putative hydrolase of the HAD superfamily